MKILQTIHHKKNELFEEEFFKDKECTEAFESKSHLYYLHNADYEAILKCVQELEGIFIIPYISKTQMPILSSAIRIERLEHNSNSHFWTLSDTKEYNERHFQTLLPNLSKYIPEDNAVLFLSEEDSRQYKIIPFYDKRCKVMRNNIIPDLHNGIVLTCMPEIYCTYKKLTIFLPHGTQSEIQKAKEVEKELKEKYGVEEVNLFVLHCFMYHEHSENGNTYTQYKPQNGLFKYERTSATMMSCKYCDTWSTKYTPIYNFNKIITTNSTGILKLEDSNERLQVIDAKEIFEEYLNENNLI